MIITRTKIVKRLLPSHCGEAKQPVTHSFFLRTFPITKLTIFIFGD